MSRVDRRDAFEREREIAGVAAEAVAGTVGRLLIAGDPTGCVKAVLPAAVSWNRRSSNGSGASAWPADESYDAAVVRLPGGWPAFAMTLHAVAARLPAASPLWVYGAGEDGIASVSRRLEGLFSEPDIVSIKKRSRVLKAARTGIPARGRLDEWRSVGDDGWVSYPGLFAQGRIDPGTEQLVQALPDIPPASRVLDFACGDGRVAIAVRRRQPAVRLTLLDNDAVALAAARENACGAETVLSDGWMGLPGGQTFDLIVSNPPIHAGRSEDFTVLAALIAGAPARLTRGGRLILVVQRTIGAGRLLSASFRTVEKRAETPHYQVWCGTT